MERTLAPSLRPPLTIASIRDMMACISESDDGSELTPLSVRVDSEVLVAGDDINRDQQPQEDSPCCRDTPSNPDVRSRMNKEQVVE